MACCQVGQEAGFSPVVGLTGVGCELTVCGLCCQVGQESGFSPVVGLTGVWCELTVCGLLSGRTGGRLLACRWSNWCVV